MNAKPNKSAKVLQTKSNNGMLITVIALVAVAVVVLGGVIWMAQRDSDAGSVEFGATRDELIEITDTGVIVVGEPSAPTVQFWEDYMCPACGSFEAQYGAAIAEAIEAGELRAEFHTLNFLNAQSGSGEYSTRALAAIQCSAANDELPVFLGVKEAFFAQQPPEGGGDLSARELASIAEDAGASADAVTCIGNVETNGGMEKASDTADHAQRSVREAAGQVSTPTVVYEGEKVEFSNPAWLSEIIS